jgi:uncharacterized protein YqhQ
MSFSAAIIVSVFVVSPIFVASVAFQIISGNVLLSFLSGLLEKSHAIGVEGFWVAFPAVA